MKIKTLKEKKAKLVKQLNEINKEIEKRELIGYRAYNFGDEYDYGSFCDFLFKNSKYIEKQHLYSKKECLERAKEFDSYEPIYTHTKPHQGRVH